MAATPPCPTGSLADKWIIIGRPQEYPAHYVCNPPRGCSNPICGPMVYPPPGSAAAVPVEQVGLEMSSEYARGVSVAVRREAGRLFQICGPATTKLLIPSVVVILGMNSTCPVVSRSEMSLAGDSRNCLTVIDQVNWR